MLTDTHAHLDYFNDPAKIIEEARAQGVNRIIVPCADPESFDKVYDIANNNDNVYSAYGVHPSDASKFNDDVLKRMIELIKTDKKVVAVGEIGLDYYYDKENIYKNLQKDIFKKQLEVAKTFDLPVLIHAREASLDTFNILKEFEMKRVLMHCYSGSLEFARECLKEGWYIAFGGVVTFKNAKKLKEVAANIPLNRIVLETDCPYLAPHPFRGEENSPKYIPLIAHEIANLKDITYDEVTENTEKNVNEFFNLGD